jgi:hypothetical protein
MRKRRLDGKKNVICASAGVIAGEIDALAADGDAPTITPAPRRLRSCGIAARR